MRRLALAIAAVAVLALAWCAITVLWGEPVTGAIHQAQVRELERRLKTEQARAADRPRPRTPRVPALADGAPVGRLHGRGIDTIVVNGNSAADLRKGPGLWHAAPGSGATTVISGHRTTYGAPFRHLDALQSGDRLRLITPYGTFTYRTTGTRIVDPNDLSVTRDIGRERLVLTACHPIYSAAQRIVVFADRVPTGERQERSERTTERT